MFFNLRIMTSPPENSDFNADGHLAETNKLSGGACQIYLTN